MLADETTKLILASAIYFRGSWLTPFNIPLTAKKPFYTAQLKDITPTDFKTLELTLPKFKLEFSMVLNEVIRNLDITDIFQSPNFSNLTVFQGALYVNEIVQKAEAAGTQSLYSF
ncbi:leukocyte elastase inhibitor-like [Drosophila hydei]|uniref:Leukocyte elastase inhibitor-like n=1 Tax=Drosophila hydei TaxID=7224 RepID=A0A6J1MH20_DROHY|nr:leukocyte elastase inhibitor-like [Drosophila hydei]